MNCDLFDTGDRDANGRHKYVCRRACRYKDGRRKVVWVEEGSPLRNTGRCSAWPLPHELREWLSIFAASYGVVGAIHICQFIRWRFRGSKLEELPPGIPHPNILQPPAPAEGPGTELEKILKAAGARSEQCGGVCQEWRDQMNRWGVEGCQLVTGRRAIINRLKEATYKTWVTDQIKIGWSLSKEPWFRYDDPIGSIVDEAIRRAEANALVGVG